VDPIRWVRVTASNPCPIRRKADSCRVTSDDCLAGCLRIETGCFRSKEGRDGSRVCLPRLGGRLPNRESSSTVSAMFSVTVAILRRLSLGRRGSQMRR
jgi:hypothetical protein